MSVLQLNLKRNIASITLDIKVKVESESKRRNITTTRRDETPEI